MDPITTAIVAALARLSETAVKDGYAGLKAIILRKLGKTSDVGKAVEDLEQKPGSVGRAHTLGEEIAAAKVDADAELLAAAHALMDTISAQPGGQQTIQQSITGNQNVVSGTGDITIRS